MTRLPRPNDGPDDAPRPPTLGELLTTAGGRLRDRHLAVIAWASGFAPVLQRADALNQVWVQRFERDETGENLPAVGRRPAVWPGRPAEEVAASDGYRSTGPTDVPAIAEAPEQRTDKVLPVDVRARLEEVAGPGAAEMRVRVDPHADAVARAQRADAVTVGYEVHLRSGRYRPDTRDGFALLAHEASHVTALLGRGPAQRSAPGGTAAEEDEARRIETLARSPIPARFPRTSRPVPASFPPIPAGPGQRGSAPLASAAPPNGSAPLPAAGTPMRADTDRLTAAEPAGFDIEALRRSLIDDLMVRVRTDFERGG
jgi:hypothetical protein